MLKFPEDGTSAPRIEEIEQTESNILNDFVMRTVVSLSVGGDRLRTKISNLYGRAALRVESMWVEANGVSKQVAFGGRDGVVIGPGAMAVSDPVRLAVLSRTKLTISVFYLAPIPHEITRNAGAEENGVASRDATRDASRLAGAETLSYTYFLTGVDVETIDARGTIVAMGDSITCGGSSSWPALLAKRLAQAGKRYGMVNAGISGNRLLRDGVSLGFGPSVLDRFDREVFEQQNLKYVILFVGINDIGVSAWDGSVMPTVADLQGAILELAARAQRRGVKFYAGTLGPFQGMGAGYCTLARDEVRMEFNQWIRTSEAIDGHFDFDRALRDPLNVRRLRPTFDSGDHLHITEAGEEALAAAVDLCAFD